MCRASMGNPEFIHRTILDALLYLKCVRIVICCTFSMMYFVSSNRSLFYLYRLKEDGSGSAYDKESMAIIKLNNTTVLYLKEVTKFLALVCILREESFERKG